MKFFWPRKSEKNGLKICSWSTQTLLFNSPAQTTAHSPGLIFHSGPDICSLICGMGIALETLEGCNDNNNGFCGVLHSRKPLEHYKKFQGCNLWSQYFNCTRDIKLPCVYPCGFKDVTQTLSYKSAVQYAWHVCTFSCSIKVPFLKITLVCNAIQERRTNSYQKWLSNVTLSQGRRR